MNQPHPALAQIFAWLDEAFHGVTRTDRSVIVALSPDLPVSVSVFENEFAGTVFDVRCGVARFVPISKGLTDFILNINEADVIAEADLVIRREADEAYCAIESRC